MKNKTTKRVLSCVLAFSILASIGIGAYLTDTKDKKDVYTVGNVQAEIVSLGDMQMNNVGALLPGTVHQYKRAAKNTGINDAYVFMSLTIPYELVGAASDDGTQLGEQMRQLFMPGDISSEWKLVTTGYIGEFAISENGQLCSEHDTHSVIANNTITYVYGYIGDNADGSLKALSSGEITSNLINTLELTNLYSVNDIDGEVSTKLYAIQSDNVNGGLADVNGVWAVINKALAGNTHQNGTDMGSGGNHTPNYAPMPDGSETPVEPSEPSEEPMEPVEPEVTGTVLEDGTVLKEGQIAVYISDQLNWYTGIPNSYTVTVNGKSGIVYNGGKKYVIFDNVSDGTYNIHVGVQFDSGGCRYTQNVNTITVDNEHKVFTIAVITSYP